MSPAFPRTPCARLAKESRRGSGSIPWWRPAFRGSFREPAPPRRREAEMKDPQIHAALERHWTASASGDQDAEHEIYHDHVILEYPQSGERIRGRQNVRAQRSEHPDR